MFSARTSHRSFTLTADTFCCCCYSCSIFTRALFFSSRFFFFFDTPFVWHSNNWTFIMKEKKKKELQIANCAVFSLRSQYSPHGNTHKLHILKHSSCIGYRQCGGLCVHVSEHCIPTLINIQNTINHNRFYKIRPLFRLV